MFFADTINFSFWQPEDGPQYVVTYKGKLDPFDPFLYNVDIKFFSSFFCKIQTAFQHGTGHRYLLNYLCQPSIAGSIVVESESGSRVFGLSKSGYIHCTDLGFWRSKIVKLKITVGYTSSLNNNLAVFRLHELLQSSKSQKNLQPCTVERGIQYSIYGLIFSSGIRI